MAEPAGLAIGAFALSGLFTTCVQCLEYISFGRNIGKDYELSVTKLDLLKTRLKAWGESLAVTHAGRENAMLRNRWTQEQKTVGNCLIGIKGILEDTKRLESRYGLRPDPQTSTTLSTTHLGTSLDLGNLEQEVRSKARQRQKSSNFFNQARWAILDKRKFDVLISDLNFFVVGLESLNDRLHMMCLLERPVPRSDMDDFMNLNVENGRFDMSARLMTEDVRSTEQVLRDILDGNYQKFKQEMIAANR